MENFPIANSFFRKLCIQNDKVSELLPLLEEALDGNQKLRQQLRAIHPELKALKFHSAIADRVTKVSVEAQNTAIKAFKCATTCYNKIVHIEQLIETVGMEDILNYTVKCKEDETLREITSIRNTFKEEAKQLDVLEGRSVVKNLRQLQIHQEMDQNSLAVLEREVYKMETHMLNKMKEATNYRNKKIIHILENKKLIDSFEPKAPGCAGSQSRMDPKLRKRTSIRLPQPALDFLNKYMPFKTNDGQRPDQEKDTDESESEQEMALQSILHRRKCVPSPAKQVRFASPDLESVHIVNRLSSMSSDDGSVGRANSEPYSGDGSKKTSQMEELIEEMEECEDWKDAQSQGDGQEVEYGELTLMESDGKESSGDEMSGAVEAGKKESTQAKKLPRNHSSAYSDEVDVKGNVKKSRNKVEVLNVLIIPPPGATSTNSLTPKEGDSKYSRFKLTANQKTSSEAMDVDEDEVDLPLQFKQGKYQKTEDEDEDENSIEFPMAQPNPTQFKAPAPMAVSPPSSDQADSMLNFSEPNCEFDDFWLSNTDDNKTMYNL